MAALPSALAMTVFAAQLIVALFVLRTLAARFADRTGGKALAYLVG